MVSTKGNITYIIERATCCAAFLFLFYTETALTVEAGAWIEPPTWVWIVGSALMGANAANLLAQFRGGK